MLTSNELHGLLPPVPTPVKSDDTVDRGAVKAMFEWMTKGAIRGVVPLGGTGEYGALSRSERLRMVSLSVEEMRGKGPVIPGVLDTGYHDAFEMGRDFAKEGADALLVVTPYYTNPTQVGIRDYFLRYADNSPIPILLYEIPYRTRIAIDPEVIHELSRHERIIGMKACNTDMYHFLQVTAGVDQSFAVLSGEDGLFPLHMAGGAKGGIIVSATLLPRAWSAIYEASRAGKHKEAIELHRQLIPLLKLAFAETNPGPIKAVMDLIGVNAPHLLAPLVPPSEVLVDKLKMSLQAQLAKTELAAA